MSVTKILDVNRQKSDDKKICYAVDGANKGMRHLIKIVYFFF